MKDRQKAESDRSMSEYIEMYQSLERQFQERTQELSALLRISHNVSSTLDLKSLLKLILDQLGTLMEYSGASIMTLANDELALLDYRGPVPREEALRLRIPLEHARANRSVILEHRPVIIPDVQDDGPLAQNFRESAGQEIRTLYSYIRSWMGVPLIAKEQVIGMLTLDHSEPHHYTERHAELALAIANQAAVAIENARLYEQAQELAALQERQRLARELHDSVSQALYGIVLGAQTARALLSIDPGRAAEPLDYVLSLAEAGLAEMRALIFELRPEALEIEGLAAALAKHATSLRARHGIEVQISLCAEPALPFEMKVAVYRIAQEALHNVVKHARATQVAVLLSCDEYAIILEVWDNGQGFDPAAAFPGHLGLRSMRERAMEFGGTLRIDSAPGKGTCVRAHIPLEAGS
ncbi:MAG: hypothetical protein KatS3mg057_3049 [Herpetosiphonaceae bacterium]|nr:MAG: hypothetical protein KatS3mg057_3049 [Herpetosiphonaceae bacterium]